MPEYLDIVDENDNVIGKEERGVCHSNPSIIHRAVHMLIMNSEGEVLLEKRSMKKDLYPGIWCNIAGHVDSGESYDEAARRELKEETGLDCKLDFLFNIRMKAEKESELISVFKCVSEGPFKINKEETQYVRFFDIEALKDMLKQGGLLTPGTFLILTKFLKNRGESNG